MSIAVAATAETAVTTAGTSHAVTLPGGGAATDLYLLIGSIGSTAATLNALADWTELLDENAAIGLKILIYTGAGVPATPTFTSSGATRSAWIAYRLTGVDKAVTPQIATTGTGTSLTPDPPSVTPTGGTSKEYLFIAFAGMAGEEADDDTWGNTPPTNYTPSPPRQKACGTVGTNLGGLILSAERLLTTGAAQDPGTFGVDVSAAWRSQHIIVHPLETHSGTGAASNTTPRATATGAKGGTSAATESNTTPRATATGQKAGTGAATESNTTPRATATGAAAKRGTATASNTAPRATATGERSVETHSGSAAASNTTPRATATGAKGGQSGAAASNTTPRDTATGAKGAAGTASESAATRATATGAKGASGAAAASNTAPRATATGAKGASAAAASNTAPRATATGQKGAVRASRVGLNHGPPNRVLHTEEFSGASVSNLWDDANTFGEFVVAGGVLTPGWNLGDDGELSVFLPDGLDGRAVSVENVSEISNGNELTAIYLGVRSKVPDTSDFFYLSVQLRGDGNLHIFSNRGSDVPSDTTIAYSHATMRYWRIRSEGAAFISETSPDRLVWTARQTVVLDGFHAPGREVRAFLGYVDAGGPEGDGAFASFQLESNGEPTVIATGAKGGQGAATATARATATATGQENSSAASVTASAGQRATASGQRGGQSGATASAAPRVTAAGGMAVTGTASVSAATRVVAVGTVEAFRHEDAVISAAPRAAGSGAKAARGAASASAGPRTTATAAKAASGASSVTSAARATGSGATDRTAAATVSVGARVTTAESRQGSATISAGVRVTTGEAHFGAAAVSATATCTANGVVSTTVVEDGWDSHADLEKGRFKIQGPGDHVKIAYPRVGSVD